MKRKLLTITIFLVTFLFAGGMVYASSRMHNPVISKSAESEQPGEAAPADSGGNSEPPQEEPVEVPTEVPVEIPTEEPVEIPTEEASTEGGSGNSTEGNTEGTTEATTEEGSGGNSGGGQSGGGGSVPTASDTDAKKNSTITGYTGVPVYDTSAIMALKQQIEATQKDKIEVQQLINDLMTTQNDFITRLQELDSMIISYQDQIDELEEKQRLAVNTAADLGEQLKVAEAEEQEQYAQLMEHIRVDYENNRFTYLDALFQAIDFNAVINELEYIRAVELYDQKLLDDLEDKRRSIANKKVLLETLDEDIDIIKDALESQQEAIELLSEEKVKQIDSYQRKIDEAQEALETIEELEKQRDAKLVQLELEYRAKLQLSTAVNVKFEGALLWPMPSSTTITSPFGPRWGSFHRGTDIACPEGSPVIAPAPGTIIYVGYMGTGGNCVMIDIGGGMTVIFYHLSAYNCSEGDIVSAGQVVAFSGNTGYSTGPHLHYAMRVNGEYVDVMQFY